MKIILTLCECLDSRLCICVFTFQHFPLFFFSFFFFLSHSCWLFFREQYTSVGPVYYSRDLQISLFNNFLLKMGLTILFIYLNIILLQCFQFSIFIKISYIQTDLMYSFGYWWKSSVLHLHFLLLLFFFRCTFLWLWCVSSGSRALFTRPTNLFFTKTFIKNRSHDTIHIFKNYCVTMFSIFSFSF